MSGHINDDDTGAWHEGQNDYCTHIGNRRFFLSRAPAARAASILKTLGCRALDIVIDMDAICHMQSNKLLQEALATINENLGRIIANDRQWNAFLT